MNKNHKKKNKKISGSQKSPQSSNKIPVVLCLFAALFSFGGFLIFILIQNQLQGFPSSTSSSNNFQNSATKTDHHDSCADVKVNVKVPADPCHDFYEFACVKGKVKSREMIRRHFSLNLQLILAGAASVCSILTEDYFKLAVASFHRRHLLKEYPNLETRRVKMVQEITENIREELILLLTKAEWLDENSRDGAIEKARKTSVTIGYPEVVKNATLVEESYKGWPDINESDFIGNIMAILKVVKDRLALLREPVDLDTNKLINSLALPIALQESRSEFERYLKTDLAN